MEKFDPDFAMFGIITADLDNVADVGNARVGYANDTSNHLYGPLTGRSIRDIVCEVAGEGHDSGLLIDELNKGGAITVEGRLNSRFVKYHSRVVQYCDDESCGIQRLVQAGIMDITEISVWSDHFSCLGSVVSGFLAISHFCISHFCISFFFSGVDFLFFFFCLSVLSGVGPR